MLHGGRSGGGPLPGLVAADYGSLLLRDRHGQSRTSSSARITRWRRSGTQIGATTLAYLSPEAMVAATEQPKDNLCRACFDGDYPIVGISSKFALENQHPLRCHARPMKKARGCSGGILMDGSLHIRRYEGGDHDAVLELHETGLREMGTFIEEPGFDLDLLDIEGVYLEGDGEFLVGVCDGQVVAMGALRKTSPGRAEVKRMRVAPAFRRRGFGQEILDALHRRATELGYATLHLDTGVGHGAARNLYEANGYRKTRRGMVGPVECIFYEKSVLA